MQNTLIEAACRSGVPFETSDSGEWIRMPCPAGGWRYIVRSRLADGYHAGCERSGGSGLEWYLTAEQAVTVPARPEGAGGDDAAAARD